MDILERLRAQCEQVEVLEVQSESTTVGFESNRLKSSKVEETSGVAVRVVRDGRLGFAASSDPRATEKLVENALATAAFGDAVPIQFPGPQPAPQVRTYDQTLVELSVARMVEMGQQIIALVREVEPEAQVNVDLKRGVQDMSIRNHAGAAVSLRRSPFSISLEVNRVRGDDVLMVFALSGMTVWEDDYLAFLDDVRAKLKLAQQSAQLCSGKMPVLFSPTGALALMLPLTVGLDGKNVYQRTSPIADKVGSQLLDAKLTLVDDATLDGKFASAPYDDEGVAHARHAFIERGVLQGFYYDLKTAAQMGVAPTGNGARSLFAAPRPSLTNLIVAAGETPLREMISGIKEGLLVEDVLGLGQGNIISGAFSNSLSLAFKIENGEIAGRVKDVSIAGNVYELLRDVAAVSRERAWVYSDMHLPHILLPGMNVVTKG